MILQVGADGLFVMNDIHTDAAQMVGGANARQHQYLRRSKCACGQNNRAACLNRAFFASALANDNACGASVFDDDLFGQCAGDDFHPVACRFDIGARGGPAFATLLRDLIQAKAVLRRAVEVIIDRQLQFGSRFDEGKAAGLWPALVRNRQRSA